jgi:hypothetical protein
MFEETGTFCLYGQVNHFPFAASVLQCLLKCGQHFRFSYYKYTEGFNSADGASGRHPIAFIILLSLLYMDVRDLVCWLDLWEKLPPPIVL